MWYNKYIDIPYLDGGRDSTGLDCWGLVRLVYSDHYGIQLPSFAEAYSTVNDTERTGELIARHKEQWQQLSEPEEGSVILFRILGVETHVGIYIGAGKFLHIRPGANSVIESIDSVSWKHRIVGYFKYQENFQQVLELTAVPHPLETKTITLPVIAGTKLDFLGDWIKQEHNLDSQVIEQSVFLVNGKPIYQKDWANTTLQAGDSVEYRALPRGGNVFRMFLFIALAVAAPFLANAAMGGSIGVSAFAAVGETGLAAGLGSGTLMASVVTGGVMMAGTMLINAIAPIPIQPMQDASSPTASMSQKFINGANNPFDQWGSIPVVLGKMRVTPPLGATNNVRFNSDEDILTKAGLPSGGGVSASDTFVDMLLIWGYGPLVIDAATLRIGQVGFYNLDTNGNIIINPNGTPSQNYPDAKLITFDRITPITTEKLNAFNAIYGKDVQQDFPNLTLTYEGLPPAKPIDSWSNSPWTPQPRPTGNTGWAEYGFTQPSDSVSISIALPQGLRATIVQGEHTGKEFGAPVGIELQYKVGATGAWLPWPGTSTTDPGHYCIGGKVQPITGTVTTTNWEWVTYTGSGEGASDSTVWELVTRTNTYVQNRILEATMIPDGFTWTATLNRVTTSASTSGVTLNTTRWAENELVTIRVRRTTGSETETVGDYRYTHQAIVQVVTSARNANPAVDPDGAEIAKTAITIQATDEVNGQIDGINAVVQTYCKDWDAATQTWIMRATSNPASLFRYVLQHPANPLPVPDAQLDLAQLQHWHEYCAQQRSLTFNSQVYTYNLQYNNVIAGGARSVLDTLREICSAGRGSPAMINGKWSIVIDEPKSIISQHFTPHNSWGFEATKLLPRTPDALRVQFVDRNSDYIPKEIIVSYSNTSATNAQLLESISLPGTTSLAEAVSHAKWHLAQIKLRPEVYTINADIEYIVCTRGDRVKLTHYVPMWGGGSGHIKNTYGPSGTITLLELDEYVTVDTSITNALRIRNSNTGAGTEYIVKKTFGITGYSQTGNIISVYTNGVHPLLQGDVVTITGSISALNGTVRYVSSTLYDSGLPVGFTYEVDTTATTPLTTVAGSVNLTNNPYKQVVLETAATGVASGDLFLFGKLGSESQDLIVTKIEPTSGKTARLTLVDYGITSAYNIFTDYASGDITSSTVFESQIQYLVEMYNQVGDVRPILDPTTFISDERAMRVISPGVFEYRMKIPFENPTGLSNDIAYVQAEIYPANSTDSAGTKRVSVPITATSIDFENLVELEAYAFRLRYQTKLGKLGPWTDTYVYGVIGKTNPPSQVTLGTTSTTALPGTGLQLAWNPNPEIDINGYEVRLTNTGWGQDSDYVYKGIANTCIVEPAAAGDTRTWYIRALDLAGLYSTTSASISYTVDAPSTYSGVVTYSYADTSTTDSTVTFTWTKAVASVFAIEKYEITLTRPDASVTVQEITGLTWTTRANWVGDATVSIKSIDILNNKSSSASVTTTITKLRPIAPNAAVTFRVSGPQVYVDWTEVTKTTLPIGGYEIRKNNVNWGVKDANLVWKGSTVTAALKNIVIGDNTWYINSFDTDNVYAASGTQITYTAQRPGIATGLVAKFSDTSTTSATVKFSWIAPAVTSFDISKYTVVLTKPASGGSVSATVDSNTWTIDADWIGTATLTITTVDVAGLTSSLNATLNVTKSVPAIPGAITATPKGSVVELKWSPVSKTTLPVSGYELRANDTGWGSDTGLTWRGSVTSTLLTVLSSGSNVYYLRAFDTDGSYSSSSRSIDVVVSAPATVGTITPTYTPNLTGTNVTLKWSKPTSQFNLDYYLVTITKPGSIVNTVRTATTEYSMPVDWTGDTTFSVKAYDVLGNSSADSYITLSKLSPAAPTGITNTVDNFGLTVSWTAAVGGSLPVAGYEIRPTGTTPGQTGYIWRGNALSTKLTSLSLGVNTWDLWSYDTDGRYSSTAATISYTAVRPSDPLALVGSFNTSLTNSIAEFKWAKPVTSVFGIARYDVSLSTTDPVRTITSSRNTTDWSVPADWLGTATLSVTAYDNLGFSSNAVTYTLSKVVPGQPGAFSTATVKGTTLSLDWPDTAKTSLPIVGYELRSSDTNWGGIGFLWKGSASNTNVDMVSVPAGTATTWYLKAYDTDNRYSSSSRSYTYTVQAPINTSSVTYQFVDTSLTSASVTLNWLDTSPVFGLKHYQITGTLTVATTTTAGSNLLTLTSTKGLSVNAVISGNANIPSGRKITQVLSATQVYIDNGTGVTAGTSVNTAYSSISYSNSTSVTQDADWLGDKTYTVKTVDLIGNLSTGTSVSITKALPSAASNLKAQVIDNTVLLYWDLPAITSLPISHVLLKKGSTWATASVIGTKSGTFTTVTELQGGIYTYWVAVVDTDGNESLPISLAATVSQPPDYVFNAEWTSTFSGTKSNAIIEANTGYLVLPVDNVESFDSHFSTRSWTGPDSQIAAGFPVYIQPGLTTGYYEEVFDYGTVLGSSQITVSISGLNISGAPDVSVLISTSSDGTTYTTFPAGTSAFGTNFRYVKIRITATQVVSGNIYSITGLVVRLDAKQRTDSGTVTLSIGGANPQGSVISDYYTWTAGMALPPTGFSLNGTAAENAIVSGTGPSGATEKLWACIDADIASDADGGFLSNYESVDSTKGYLFAVFVKTTTNDGSTYLGTSNNSTILNLAGTTNTNPYFIGPIDLPAINTWYLLIGYVYPVGYGTTDGGISGVYDLTGTKLVSGTSFKFAAGTNTARLRAVHYYNTTGTGNQVQFMAKPVVIQCDAADAASKISYLLKCVNSYGATVVPAVSYVDITSITTTPNSTVPTTPVVDFYDKPYPTRFNIFNYNSTGSNVGGTLSWTVRGY